MLKPALPANEHQRLASVHATGLLDTPIEERFDRITRIAQHLFDVPIALVSVVDGNRQWFKSCIGLSVSETSREISFCGHAILGDRVFVVEDTALDLRFADNPLVVEDPFIRFYAGYPIRLGTGSKFGTLCIIDRAPRRFNDADRNILADLGMMVESELSNIEISVTDDLTGLLNRRGFELILKNNLSISRRNQHSSTLVYFDLNDFKPVNDRYGHARGDQLLADFARLLSSAFRESDVVARLGGDEFATLLNHADADSADKALTALTELIKSYNAEMEDDVRLAFSHGAITFDPGSEVSISELVAEADRRMYEEKAEQSYA